MAGSVRLVVTVRTTGAPNLYRLLRVDVEPLDEPAMVSSSAANGGGSRRFAYCGHVTEAS
jgi:hypothetical protein